MAVTSKESRPIQSEDDIAALRASVKRIAALLNFGPVSQTKVVTAASELARNALEHGHGGTVEIELLEERGKTGIRMVFQDSGQGIPDTKRALEDGYTTTKGMGLGLGGAKRLMDEFYIESDGGGTRVSVTKWNLKT
jgi:serine/threonine-protein kinase RsbT